MTSVLVLIGISIAAIARAFEVAQLRQGRVALAESLSHRLRTGSSSLDWLNQADRDLAAASNTAALGVIIAAATLPGAVSQLSVGAAGLPLFLAGAAVIWVMGYLAPTRLGAVHSSKMLALLQPIMKHWGRLMSPVIPTPEWHDRKAAEQFLSKTAAGSEEWTGEMAMVGGVLNFSSRQVREVMVPRTEIVAVQLTDGYQAIARAFSETGFSRLPVYRDSLDDIVGMIHALEFFKADRESPLPIRAVAMAPEGRSCADLLVDMQRERRHMAIVIDEFGGTMGLVTMENLLEALVGEIFDEDEPLSKSGGATPNGVVDVDGLLMVSELESRLESQLPPGFANTVVGRLTELLGRIPGVGERIAVGDLEFDIVAANPARLERVFVRHRDAGVTRLGGIQP